MPYKVSPIDALYDHTIMEGGWHWTTKTIGKGFESYSILVDMGKFDELRASENEMFINSGISK